MRKEKPQYLTMIGKIQGTKCRRKQLRRHVDQIKESAGKTSTLELFDAFRKRNPMGSDVFRYGTYNDRLQNAKRYH